MGFPRLVLGFVARRRARHIVLCILALALSGCPSSAGALTAAAPGELDGSFADGGELVVQANPACARGCVEFFGSYADTMLRQTDGKIVLAGSNVFYGDADVAVPNTALVRANADGAPDISFGVNGLVDGPPFAIWHIYETRLHRLLVVGGQGDEAGVEELDPDGAVNDAFGPFGAAPVRSFPTQLPVFAAQVDQAGRIVVVAGAPAVHGGAAGPIEVMRFLPQGTPDRGFGSNGIVVLHGLRKTGAVRPLAVALQADGGTVIMGQNYDTRGAPTGRVASKPKPFLTSLTAKGTLASSFGQHGILRLPPIFSYDSPVLAPTPGGGVLLAFGESPEEALPVTGQGSIGPHPRELMRLMRFTPSGRLDQAFGHAGVASDVLFADGRGSVAPAAIAFDAHRDPLVVGSQTVRTIDTGSAGSWFLVRYTPHGRDCSFGRRGAIYGNRRGSATAVAVQPDGRIVIAGDSGHAFMTARYIGGGPTRTCPGERRPTRHSPPRRRSRARDGGRGPGA